MQPSVELARLKKSIALADLFFAHGITAEDTAQMTFAEWTMAALVARVNPPHSAETRQMVGALLQKRAGCDGKIWRQTSARTGEIMSTETDGLDLDKIARSVQFDIRACKRCRGIGIVSIKHGSTYETDSDEERALAWHDEACPDCIRRLIDVLEKVQSYKRGL